MSCLHKSIVNQKLVQIILKWMECKKKLRTDISDYKSYIFQEYIKMP